MERVYTKDIHSVDEVKQLTQLVWYNIAVSLNHDGTDGPSGIQSSRLPVIRHAPRLRLQPVRLSTQPQ